MTKIERTFPAPASLATESQKASGKYDKPDVVKQLREDANLANEVVDVRAKNVANKKAVLTATLVEEVFNLKNTGMRIYKSEVRFLELNKEMNKLYDNLEELNKNPDSKIVMRKLKAIFKRESAFAAFKRNYIRDNKEMFPQLMGYID